MGNTIQPRVSTNAADLGGSLQEAYSWELPGNAASVSSVSRPADNSPPGTATRKAGAADPTVSPPYIPLNDSIKTNGRGFSVTVAGDQVNGLNAASATIPLLSGKKSSLSALLGVQLPSSTPAVGFPTTWGLSGQSVLGQSVSLHGSYSAVSPNDGTLGNTDSLKAGTTVKFGKASLTADAVRSDSHGGGPNNGVALSAKVPSGKSGEVSANFSTGSDRTGRSLTLGAGYSQKDRYNVSIEFDQVPGASIFQGSVNFKF